MPSTCHAFTSTYELIASAARNDLLRLVVRASASSLFLVSRSKRTLTVVDFVIPLPYVCNVHIIYRRPIRTSWRAFASYSGLQYRLSLLQHGDRKSTRLNSSH